MRIVVSGSIGRFPVGGHAWADLQYVLGLRGLGHEVLYLEDCGAESWVYDWGRQELTTELDYPVSFVRDSLKAFGLDERWIYRAGAMSAGISWSTFADFCAAADVLIIRAVPFSVWRPEYDLPRSRVFIDADPLFTQVALLRNHAHLQLTLDRCDRLFTIGQRIGAPDCTVPSAGREWVRTLPPVVLDEWPVAPHADGECLTSILQWRSYRDIEFDGALYGNKDREFAAYIDLPRRVPQPLCLAATGAPPGVLEQHGWRTVEGWTASADVAGYRCFIQRSRGELSVAKHGYVASRCGWFSDRSVCYLASGRPVIVEDTGLDWLPRGSGVLAFRSMETAIESVAALERDYAAHCTAARKLAEQVFDSRRVLTALLEAAEPRRAALRPKCRC